MVTYIKEKFQRTTKYDSIREQALAFNLDASFSVFFGRRVGSPPELIACMHGRRDVQVGQDHLR